MKRFKVFIKRFEDTVDAGTIVTTIEMRAKGIEKTANEYGKATDTILNNVNKITRSTENLSSNQNRAITQMKSAIQSYTTQLKELDKLIIKTGKQKYTTGGFKQEVQTLQNKDILKRNQMGFTGGQSNDLTQLNREAVYLESQIQSKVKLINNEHQTRVKLVNQELNAAKKQLDIEQRAQEIAAKTAQKQDIQAQKEAARVQAQAAKEQAAAARAQVEQANRSSFQASYTDLGPGNEALTQQYRAEFQALLEKLPAEQQSVAMKKLMANENKNLVNSFLQEVAELKRTKLASTETVTGIDKLREALDRLNNRTEQSKNKFKEFIDKLRSTLVTWRIIGGFIKSLVNGFTKLYQSAADYEEAFNLYRTTMGKEYFEQANDWVKKISDALYLDPKVVMEYSGGFFNLVRGLGASSEAAFSMSRNLTQLSFDLASFLNIEDEAAHDKLQSAITGQSRAVASAGVAMQQASLQEAAYTLQLGKTKIALDDNALARVKNSIGIKKSVSDMTQAEKTYLRYIQIMRSTKHMQGDLGKTIITPANAVRVLRRQFELLSRALGEIFIPIILKVVPYIMVLVEKLRALANLLSKWTGYKMAPVDYDKVDGLTNSFANLGDAANTAAGKTKKAADSINRSLAPFDELNVVESENSGAGSGIGGVGAGGTGGSVLSDLEKYIDDYDYDMLKNLDKGFEERLDNARQNFDKILDVVKLIGGSFLTWKLSKKFMEDYIKISDFSDKIKKSGPIKSLISNPALQTVATIAGVLLQVYLNFKSVNDETDRLKQAWKTGDWNRYFKIDSLDELIDKVRTLTFILQGGLVAALVIAGNKLGWFEGLINKLKEAFKIAKDFIVDKAIKPIGDEIERIYKKNIEPSFKDIKYIYNEFIKPVFKDIVTSVSESIDVINDLLVKSGYLGSRFKASAELIKTGFIKFLKDEFSGALTVVKNNIDSFLLKINSITGTYKGVVKIIKGIAQGDWKTIWQGVKTTVVNAFKGMITPIASALLLILSMLENLINGFIGALQGVVKAINKIKIKFPDWLPGKLGGKEFAPDLKEPSKISLGTSAIQKFLRAKEGIEFVPKDYFGPVYLDYGERVLTKEENKEYMQGNTNYLSNLTRNSASTNNNQLVNDLARAIVDSMTLAEANRQPGITQVYIGNDKVYEGQGQYQNRQAERYGTNLIKI